MSMLLIRLPATIFLIVVVILIVTLPTEYVMAQSESDLSEDLVIYLNIYKANLSDVKPKGFEDFEQIEIKKFPKQNIYSPETDSNGKTFIDGEVQIIDGKIFKFKEAFLKKQESDLYQYFEFKTFKIKSTYYVFKGEFLKNLLLENGQYTKLKGKLIKYKNDKEISSAELSFYQYAEL